MVQEKNNIGVIVARFQVDELTVGHKQVIDQVVSNHNKVIIFLGISKVSLSGNNPLEFTVRKMMIEKHYPAVQIIPLSDVGDDYKWSIILDARIREVYPHGDVILYGSRDSFIPHYHGKFKTSELEPTHVISGTITRKQISDEVLGSRDFRKGIIYACTNKYPTGYPTIDIAPIKTINDAVHVLLCKKLGEENFRFIGGFFDPEKDKCYEDTVHREFKEETTNGIIDNVRYVKNIVIDDVRYRGEKDKIITMIFVGDYVSGDLLPADDINEIKWCKITSELVYEINSIHKALYVSLINTFKL
jgi:bifunctional NMN adenylyltransferase/nudix hydrolase